MTNRPELDNSFIVPKAVKPFQKIGIDVLLCCQEAVRSTMRVLRQTPTSPQSPVLRLEPIPPWDNFYYGALSLSADVLAHDTLEVALLRHRRVFSRTSQSEHCHVRGWRGPHGLATAVLRLMYCVCQCPRVAYPARREITTVSSIEPCSDFSHDDGTSHVCISSEMQFPEVQSDKQHLGEHDHALIHGKLIFKIFWPIRSAQAGISEWGMSWQRRHADAKHDTLQEVVYKVG